MMRFVLHPSNLRGKPLEKFRHLVRYRNTFHQEGEDPTAVSDFLGIDITSFQKKVIGPTSFEVSSRQMLQDSCLSRGYKAARRKVAARTLNQAAILNGKATLLTSERNLAQVMNFVQLSASIEEYKAKEAAAAERKKAAKTAEAAERRQQRDKRNSAKQAEMDQLVGLALQKLEVETVAGITSASQLTRLTSAQLNALHWSKANKTVQGSKAEKLAAVCALLHLTQ